MGLLLLIAVEYLGLSKHLPILKVTRFSTILSYGLLLFVLIRIGPGDIFSRAQTRIFIFFVALTGLSVIWAVVQIRAFESIRPLVDYLALFILVKTLVNTWNRVLAMAWVFSIVCVALVLMNVGKLFAAARVGFYDAPYFMGDGNDFAWALVVALPITLHLAMGSRPFLTRFVGLTAAVTCLIGVIGTESRGGTIGLAAAMTFYWAVLSRRKALTAAVLLVVAIGVLVLAPGQYLSRMQSVGQYQQDNSAQARLQAWRAATRMAIDYPLGVGAGNFSSAYGRFYMPPADQSAIGWAPGRWLSTHSIYFRVLAEYGFLGLAMLLVLIWTNLRENLTSHRHQNKSAGLGGDFQAWPALLNMSLVGYAVCGIFLGGFSYPHLYLLSALTISAARLTTGPRPFTPAPMVSRRPRLETSRVRPE